MEKHLHDVQARRGRGRGFLSNQARVTKERERKDYDDGRIQPIRFVSLLPLRLGEWRRGLQDALGLERDDFGPNSGIVLFERANGLLERADRLEERGDVPLILIDAAEQCVDIPILQFPLWLAFAADPTELFEEEELL